MFDVTYGGAFLAGLLSFASPCVLPIVPPYLAYLAGLTFDELQDDSRSAAATRQLILAAVGFVLGFTTVFVALGATASIIGQSLARYFELLSMVAGAIILVMGLHFLGVFRIALFFREARVQVSQRPVGPAGAYVMGLAFAFGWTPCVGPILSMILFMAGAEATASRGALLLTLYSLGIGLPFLLAAVFATRFLDWAKRFRHHLHKVEMAMGGLLVLTGVLFMTGQMAAIAYWLLEIFPQFQEIG